MLNKATDKKACKYRIKSMSPQVKNLIDLSFEFERQAWNQTVRYIKDNFKPGDKFTKDCVPSYNTLLELVYNRGNECGVDFSGCYKNILSTFLYNHNTKGTFFNNRFNLKFKPYTEHGEKSFSFAIPSTDNIKGTSRFFLKDISIEHKRATIRIPKSQKYKIKNCTIDLVYHREIIGRPTLATISRNSAGEYFISFSCDVSKKESVEASNKSRILGIDMCMNGNHAYSDGSFRFERRKAKNFKHNPKFNPNKPVSDENPKYISFEKTIKDLELRISNLQRKLSKKVRGSKNYEDLLKKINNLQVRKANTTKDFERKEAFNLINKCDSVAVEDVDIKSMQKRKKGRVFSFGASVGRMAYYQFKLFLNENADNQGKEYVKVHKFYPSSKLCSFIDKNGNVSTVRKTSKELPLSCRIFEVRGKTLDRDTNAARNIAFYALEKKGLMPRRCEDKYYED